MTLVPAVAIWSAFVFSQTSVAASATANPTSFTTIYHEIFAPAGCAAAFCHGAHAPAGALLMNNRDRAYEAMVGVPAAGTACVGRHLLRVAPGDPEASLLLMKLTDRPPCGMAMPALDALLRDSQIAVIRRWIESGAPDN